MNNKYCAVRNTWQSVRFFFATIGLVLATLVVPQTSVGDGISGTGLHIGPAVGLITQFRSLVINGEHYETTNAIVRINGVQGLLEELRLGQQVVALVDFDLLQVLEVDQYDAVTGEIESIEIEDETLGRMELDVAGQKIYTGLETVYHVDKPTDLKKGDRVTIGGLRNEDDVILASALEVADKESGTVVAGIVRNAGEEGFDLGDLRVTSPYMLEILTADWFYEGATVLVSSPEKKVKDATLDAERIIPVPPVVVILEQYFEFGEARIDGEIEGYDVSQSTISVAGVSISLDEHTTLHDARDNERPFGLIDIYPGDHVSLSVQEQDGVLRARKLVRIKKADRLLRGRVQEIDAASDSVVVFDQRLYEISDLKEARYLRHKLKKEELPEVLRAADGVEIRLDRKQHGRIKRLTILPDCEDELAALRQENVDMTDKEIREELKEQRKRAYYCL